MQNNLKFIYKIRMKNGQSLIEIIVAMAIFSLMAVSMISLLLGGLTLSTEGGRITNANMLAQEGMEAVQSIKDRAWNELVYDRSAINIISGEWQFVGEGLTEQIGNFSRTINFFDVYRDLGNVIVSQDEDGALLDKETKKVEVLVSWDTGRGSVNLVRKYSNFTNWDSITWTQNDWSGGSGQQEFGALDAYDFDDGYIEASISGEMTLKEVATSTFADQGYLISSAYDLGDNRAYGLIYVDGEVPEECTSCEILVQMQTADDDGGSPGTWSSSWSGPNGEDGNESDYYLGTTTGAIIHADHNGDRWFRYKIILLGEADNTPVVRELRLNYKN